MEHTRFIADICGMGQRVHPGMHDYAERLVCGPWTEGLFVVAGPGEVIPAAPFAKPGSVLP